MTAAPSRRLSVIIMQQPAQPLWPFQFFDYTGSTYAASTLDTFTRCQSVRLLRYGGNTSSVASTIWPPRRAYGTVGEMAEVEKINSSYVGRFLCSFAIATWSRCWRRNAWAFARNLAWAVPTEKPGKVTSISPPIRSSKSV